jgi:uncharacterized RDD family membrane protein YckC
MNAIAPASAPARGPQFDNRRVLAGLIDLAIVAVMMVALGVAVGLVAGDGAGMTTALRAVLLGWALFYYFALESGAGQTVGKRVMGLRVTMADGSHADMRAVAVRTVLRVIDGFAFYVVGLIVMLATGERRQRLGDLAGGTIVTSADAPAAPTAAASSAVASPASEASAFNPLSPEALVEPPPVADAPLDEPVVEPFPLDVEPDVAPEPDLAPAAIEPASAPFADETPAAPEPFDSFSSPAGDADGPVVEPADPVEPTVDAFAEAPVVEVESGPAASAPAEEPASDWSIPAPSEPVQEPAAEATEDEPVKVRSVETVSAIDLVMGEVEEDEAAGSAPTA